LTLALTLGTAAALVQPLSGDVSAKHIARNQPAKLAAAEAHFETQRGAPIVIGGIPDAETGTVRGAIRIPRLLSFLATERFDGEVVGLNDFPRAERPNVGVTHTAFDVMVGSAFAMIALGAWFWFGRWRRREPGRWLLRALVAGSPLGIVALEAGWIVTEAGRQPWIVRGVLLTREGVTPVGGVAATFFGFSLLYLVLGTALALLLRGLSTGAPPAAVSPSARPEAAHAG